MAEVVWTEPALNSLDEIADYIAVENLVAASHFVKNVFDEVELLEVTPRKGRVPIGLKKTPYRRLVISPVYVYYRLEGVTSIVLFIERQ
tara:strand:+ start:159 stop:425 length:267 start_codon:yes stop_codon:yes gene_type:complete